VQQTLLMVMPKLARQNQPPVRLGIFSLNEAGFNQIVSELQRHIAGKAIQLQFTEFFEPGTRDFRSQVSRSLRLDVDALLILGLSPEIEILARQLKSLRKRAPISSIEAIGLAENKSDFNGAWFIDAAAPTTEFEERFRKSYGREVSPGAAHAYDTVQLIAEAFEAVSVADNKPGPMHVAAYLRSHREFKGVVGSLTVGPDGVIHSRAVVKVVDGGVSYRP
jgi:ABC-type branched-subunit amino acid transport system substrate-binding protein